MPDLIETRVPAIEPKRLAELRKRAAARLSGEAATKGPTARAADALTVLHALASSPQTASDALALLHELQVHQVELDLQAQELRESRAELESALQRLTAIHEAQPVGFVSIDPRTVLHELNPAAAAWLGLGREQARGLALDTLLDPEGTPRFRAALARIDAGRPQAACRLSLRAGVGNGSEVLACIARDPSAPGYLVNLVSLAIDAADPAPHDATA